MKVLVIGAGGREHALCWKLKESKSVSELYCAPGNAGIARVAENIAIPVDAVEALCSFAVEKSIDLTIVGPEYPLTLGIVDHFEEKGLKIFGPNRQAARLEGSKAYAKEIMDKAGVPTASYREFLDLNPAVEYVKATGAPIVVKADGLAAGKGVYVCATVEEAQTALNELFNQDGFEKVVIEEYLEGIEASFIALVSGDTIIPLASSHDYKRIFDGDGGPNTGGMGTVSPSPRISAAQEVWALENVMRPVVHALKEDGIFYRGFLYAGLMISPDGAIKVLEFNARMGDPEGQVILRRMQGDLAELLESLSGQDAVDVVGSSRLQWCADSAVCVVQASEGYPASSSRGDVITGIEAAEALEGCVVFHAGTGVDSNGNLVTAGGRVFNITALGPDVNQARTKAYEATGKIQFRGMQFRSDIAAL